MKSEAAENQISAKGEEQTLPEYAVKFTDVSFSYAEGESPAVNGVNLSVRRGEFLAVLGHNGSGKSTLARLICGLLEADRGRVTTWGLDPADKGQVNRVRRHAGVVFQNPDNQMVASIVEDDVAFGPENLGVPREEIGRRIEWALDAVGMSEFRHATPTRLSGGQKQRIAVAGVLAIKPDILILDESTAMLDPKGRREVMEVARHLNREEGMTVILITHFMEEALLADRAVVMNKGEIVMSGSPEEIFESGEQLETFNLCLPEIGVICRDLNAAGIRITPCLRPQMLARQIASLAEQRGVTRLSQPHIPARSGQNTEEPLANNALKADGDSALQAERQDFSAEERGLENAAVPNGIENAADGNEITADGNEITADGKGEWDIDVKNLVFTYSKKSPFATHALKGVDLHIAEGEFFGVIGHTGSGKSTLVQHLNALIKLPQAEKHYKKPKAKKGCALPPEPQIRIGKFDLSSRKCDWRALRADVGMVFQYPEYQLFAETVFDDVAFGLKNFRPELSKEEVEKAVRESLTAVGLDYEEIHDKSPFDLSGGQKRRVAIAGVIVTKPHILILDEPAAGLDPLGKREIMRLLHSFHGDWCKTVVIVSHDMDEIAENCTRACVLSDGRIFACDTPTALFSHSDALLPLGLDAPLTAKICDELSSLGVLVECDYTSKGFTAAVTAGRIGGNADA